MNRNEEIEQAKVVRWSHLPAVRALMPALCWLHHSPNGGRRDSLTGAQMKAMGTKPGFPDLLLPVGVGGRPGLVIEMKSATGRLSEAQKPWAKHFEAEGWTFTLARSAEDARVSLCQYLGMPPDAVPALDA